MAARPGSWLDARLHRRGLRRWARARAHVGRMAPALLARLRQEATAMRVAIDGFERAAAERLDGAAPDPAPPLHGDWAWRPPLWQAPVAAAGWTHVGPGTELSGSVKLFHDAAAHEIALRQYCPAARRSGTGPCGVSVEVFGFDGRFLSLVVDLPDAAAQGLSGRHLVSLALALRLESPIEVFARLNIHHGPNTVQFVRELPPEQVGAGAASVDFDLGSGNIAEGRADRLWLDLIFERPRMNRITVDDMVLARRPRAGM